MVRFTVIAVGAAVALVACGGAAPGAPLLFDRQVRPILSDKCFQCHGPDAETREADLRLDTKEGLQSGIIEPGSPDESELLRRVLSEDADERMPPPESGLSLSAAEKDALRQWIAEGAAVAGHWAFENLPAEVPVPQDAGAGWARGELDRFVAARLAAEGLEPTPQATPLRLLRRAALDLTGLPPSVAEIERFEADVTKRGLDKAYETAVLRMLDSPAYGEQMAVGWLDAARYADSYGYQSDQLNSQWPWRDWVVRAFNDNMRYDQFLTRQLAGDMLRAEDWHKAQDNQLATAFGRLHRMTNEGGSIPEEWLLENAVDRTNVFGTAVLGLTLECSRCHDHKYDPITQRDYFSILAFFNSIDENGLYDHASKTPSPSMLVLTDEQNEKLLELRVNCEIAGLEASFDRERDSAGAEALLGRYRGWRERQNTEASADGAAKVEGRDVPGFVQGIPPDCVGRFDFEGDLAKLENKAHGGAARVETSGLAACEGASGQGVEFDGDTAIEFPELLPVDHWDPWTIDLRLRDTLQDERPVVLAHRTFGTDVGYNGVDLMLESGHVSARIYRVWPGNGFGVRTTQPLAKDQWQHLAVTYDGSNDAAGFHIYVDGRLVETEVLRAGRVMKSAGVRTHGTGHFAVGARFRDRGFCGGRIDDLSLFRRALAPLEIAELHEPGAIAAALAAPGDEERLRDYYLAAIDEPLRTARAAAQAKRKELAEYEEGLQEVAVMASMQVADDRGKLLPYQRPTYALARGAYDSPKSEENRVSPGVFGQILPPLPEPEMSQQATRLTLAEWVTAPDHPLTARVFVNRVWANFFGRGLVRTPENFGSQGAAPTHPELLDWLARDFVAGGWDVKQLCYDIVTSAAYRQDSRADAELRERDPENLLLARGPAFRLSAEQVRDLALASSGLLQRELGGPPVSPYQPGEDLWRESNAMSPPYKQSVGKELHRRSLYSVWKRTAPLPNMLAFDATTREVCTVNRSRTNTPLQALVLLNDVQFVEAARALAVRVMQVQTGTAVAEASAPEAGIARAMRAVAGRAPTAEELAVLTDLYDEQLKLFAGAPAEDVAKFLAMGESRSDAAATPQLAAMTVVCQTILNLDAAIMRR